MASPITHIILVNQVQNYFQHFLESKRAEELEIIFNLYPGELNIGAISPDLLYFTDGWTMKLFALSGMQDMHEIADLMHTSKTNQFFLESVKEIKKIKDVELKRKFFSFISGHLAHIVADGIVHPYIRDKVGDYSDKTKLNHRMLEMRLDVFVTEDFAGFNMNDCQLAEYLDCENTKPIAEIITSSINKVYEQEIASKYKEKLKIKTVEGSIDASRRALKSSSGNFNLKWYFGNLLEKYGVKHPDLEEIKAQKTQDIFLTIPIDKAENKLTGNFLKTERVDFLHNVCPQFIEKYIEKVDTLYDVVFLGADLKEDDFQAINLDTGRLLSSPDLNNVPFYWG